jgi:hypothetical protein
MGPGGHLVVSSSSPVASCGGGSQVTVQNSPPVDADSHFPPLPLGKRSLLVGSVEVLLVPPDPGPRVPSDSPLLFWLRKGLASSGCFLSEDFIPALASDLSTHPVLSLRSRDLYLTLKGEMTNQGRGRGRGGGNFRPEGDQAGSWLPQNQNQMQQQNPNQQMGFGYGFPPNWGFPGQFPGPFPVN